MSQLTDLIMKQVNASAGNVAIPSNIKDRVLGGLSESVMGSLTQTVAQPGGVDAIKDLVTGKVAASNSPVTGLASSLFSGNVLSKLNLDPNLATSLSGIVPSVMSKLSGVIKDMDGDGDIDFKDVILMLKGGQQGGGLLGMASSLLSGFMKK